MSRAARATAMLLAALSFRVSGAVAAPLAERPEIASRLELYRLWVEDERAFFAQPAVSIAIVYDQELVWARGFGVADLESGRPATPETVYRLGSISKTFTATALLQLRDAGRLRLDDPVSRYLPSFHPRGAEGGEVTVWNLLTHTSGLPRDAAFPYWTSRSFPSEEQIHAGLERQELQFPPGSDYQYSNLGLALAGEVAAAAAGPAVPELIRRQILEPLGLAHTYVELPPAAAGLAQGYLPRRADGTRPRAPETDARGLTPAANLSSNVLDLARFVSAQLGGPPERRLLAAATLREMQRVQFLARDWSSGRGLGFLAWRQGGRTLVGHGGWVAGHRGQIAFDPATKVGVVVLTNSDEGGPAEYVKKAFELVAPAIEKAVTPAPKSVPLVAPERFVGTYHNPWGEETEVLLLDGELVLYDHAEPPAADVEAALTHLAPESEGGTVFRLGAGPRKLVFEMRPDGKVARIRLDENYLYPADCGALGPDLQCTAH
ncbi:MAG: serine hydrolase [Thermoanaerobaculia bacterium]